MFYLRVVFILIGLGLTVWTGGCGVIALYMGARGVLGYTSDQLAVAGLLFGLVVMVFAGLCAWATIHSFNKVRAERDEWPWQD